jgi:hypothetical protein
MRTPTFVFFSDPGHGWLRVLRAQLKQLGVEDKVSRYSYQRGKWAYLEEDCDAALFINAMREAGWSFVIKQKNSAYKYSTIRQYGRFAQEVAA